MKLENQVTSLEISKRLKELGVKQESLYQWGYHGDTLMLLGTTNGYTWPEKDNGGLVPCSAFTVAELGEMLPARGQSYKIQPSYKSYANILFIPTIFHPWGIRKYPQKDLLFESETEADARGKMLIYLLENKLISLK